MTRHDYFLYDNRTRSTWGRDWGLKAATGALRRRPDLKRRFHDYCAVSFDTRRGALAGFDHAIGGVPDPRGIGFLLCVTLESRDHSDRPSCALLGIWLPRRHDLRRFLEASDPVASARELIASGDPPPELVPVGQAAGDLRERVDAAEDFRAPRRPGPDLRRFHPIETPRYVLSLLRRRAATGTPTPAILGVTALVARGRLHAAGIDLAFCLPPDASSRMALKYHLDRHEAVRAAAGPEPLAESETGNISSRWRSIMGRLARPAKD